LQVVEKTRSFGAESSALLGLPLAKRTQLKTLRGNVERSGRGITKQKRSKVEERDRVERKPKNITPENRKRREGVVNESERNRNRRYHKIGFGCKVENRAKVVCGNMWPTCPVSLQLCTLCFLSNSLY